MAGQLSAAVHAEGAAPYTSQRTSYSLVAVWQVEVHNGIKHKAQLSALVLLWISLRWQELVNVGVSDAIHLLHGCWFGVYAVARTMAVSLLCILTSPQKEVTP